MKNQEKEKSFNVTITFTLETDCYENKSVDLELPPLKGTDETKEKIILKALSDLSVFDEYDYSPELEELGEKVNLDEATISKFAKKSKAKFNDKTLQNIQRSLSCVFDKNITIASILKTISKTKSLTNIAIADIFEDESRLGPNKQSINIEFEIDQDSQVLTNQALTKDDIDNVIVAEIIKNLQSIGGTIRDGK
jgi:ferredoxin-fold anticodon binding domain-containing protein